MIGHALTMAQHPAARVEWDRWIAVGFAIGSACFIGPFPGWVQLVGQGADSALFFAALAYGVRTGSHLLLKRWLPAQRAPASASSSAPCCCTTTARRQTALRRRIG
jgi:hypothetical protein